MVNCQEEGRRGGGGDHNSNLKSEKVVRCISLIMADYCIIKLFLRIIKNNFLFL